MTQRRHPLMDRFPQFFEPGLTGGLIDGGFTTGPGWDGVIAELLERLAALGLPQEFRGTQVKEKFGELRFYHNGQCGGLFDEVESLIAAASARSVETCEQCGQAGSRVSDGGWVRSLCASCMQRRGER